MPAQYRLVGRRFIAPHLYEDGSIIEFDGEPGVDMEPLNDEAREAVEALYLRKPNVAVKPFEELPRTFSSTLIEPPPPDTTNYGNIADPERGRPGPTERGGDIARAKPRKTPVKLEIQ